MRATLNSIPSTNEIKNQAKIPFGLLVSPLAETVPEEVPVPTVDHGEPGPLRCNRCKAYINPFVMWNQSGTQYTCPVCFIFIFLIKLSFTQKALPTLTSFSFVP